MYTCKFMYMYTHISNIGPNNQIFSVIPALVNESKLITYLPYKIVTFIHVADLKTKITEEIFNERSRFYAKNSTENQNAVENESSHDKKERE